MATWTKFEDFSEQLARGIHDFDAHTFKIVLTNVAPVATNTVLADLTQIANGNGYTTGGEATTIAVSEAAGTTTVTGTQVVWTGSGAGMATARYAALYNDTAASGNLVAFTDYGVGGFTLAAGETFTLKPNNASPGTLFTLA